MVEDDSQIGFEDAPLITPNGDVLVESVTFSVKRGENLMIVGPNGKTRTKLIYILRPARLFFNSFVFLFLVQVVVNLPYFVS